MKISVIIPNYNGEKFLADCLDALREQTYQDFDILVVDNASEDDSLDILGSYYPEAQIIRMSTNTGFAAAVNAGIRAAQAPYVCLLNNDTIVEPEFLEKLLETMESSKKIFSVASKMIQMYQPDLLDSAGDSYNLLGWAVNRGVGRSVDLYQDGEDVFSACAGAALYRRAVFGKIGLFDEDHFCYLEDIDVCWRALIYGHRNVYCPGARVHHVGSGTSGSRYNSFKVKLAARNNVYLNYKNMPTAQLIFNLPWLALGTAVKCGFFFVRGFGADYIAGLKDGIAGRKSCKKVPFRMKHFLNYVAIEGALIVNLGTYTVEWFRRKLHLDKLLP